MNCPKLLIISHTSFTKSNSMGSTLASYFKNYDSSCLAQFYIKKMEPDIPVCKNYYRITDEELMRKIIHPFKSKIGSAVKLKSDEENNDVVPSNLGLSKRRYFNMLLRKVLWGTKLWYNRDFKMWISNFSPQIIMIQPGDFSYLFKIGVFLANKLNVPLIVHQSESYFMKSRSNKPFYYKIFQYDFVKSYKKLMKRTDYCIYLFKGLEDEYSKYFSVPSTTIMKGTSNSRAIIKNEIDKTHIRFIYAGNLGEKVGRCIPLVEFGKEIKKLGFYVDVYTNSKGNHMIDLVPDNGIILHDSIPYELLKEEIQNSDFVIHIESQEKEKIEELKYAFSTKIADMLSCGVCSIIYGSTEIAAISYFKEYKLGCVIERREDIANYVRKIIDNDELRNKYIYNALEKAKKDHDIEKNSEYMKNIIISCYEQSKNKIITNK